MDPYSRSTTGTRFRYDPNLTRMDDDGGGDTPDQSFAGVLEIYAHHATNIHNICIYENQDVYAKFSLTYNPDDAVSTRIVHGGGKNPEFNEKIAIKVSKVVDAVVKCEIWMFSRARNLMDDQLLGFALVPVSQVIGKGEISRDYSLSSTDLFHSPAGTVKLTLCLTPSVNSSSSSVNSSISSEVVLLDRKIPQVVEYSKIEFPDVNVVQQNQQMVSEYFHRKLGSFLHLGNLPPLPDCEMTSDDDHHRPSGGGGGGSVSPGGSHRASSGFISSTTTSFSDERNSSGKKSRHSSSSAVSVSGEGNQSSSSSSGGCPDTPTSSVIRDDKDGRKEEGNGKYGEIMTAAAAAPPPLIPKMKSEAEESAMQKQIVDMYMRSMQQFTESLAKMKLPMDLDKPGGGGGGGGDLIQGIHHGNTTKDHNQDDIGEHQQQQKKKKDGSRVFYGSRAFF